tara:strand:+ start:332 stop:523 length:192 start_codon:yes stop_codon:yes gene_type:complete
MKYAAILESGSIINFDSADVFAVRLADEGKGATVELYVSEEQAERLIADIWEMELPTSNLDIN